MGELTTVHVAHIRHVTHMCSTGNLEGGKGTTLLGCYVIALTKANPKALIPGRGDPLNHPISGSSGVLDTLLRNRKFNKPSVP
jgi:hypothetical protein